MGSRRRVFCGLVEFSCLDLGCCINDIHLLKHSSPNVRGCSVEGLYPADKSQVCPQASGFRCEAMARLRDVYYRHLDCMLDRVLLEQRNGNVKYSGHRLHPGRLYYHHCRGHGDARPRWPPWTCFFVLCLDRMDGRYWLSKRLRVCCRHVERGLQRWNPRHHQPPCGGNPPIRNEMSQLRYFAK